MRGSTPARVAVLLLHEDYPHELPVYHLKGVEKSGDPSEFDRVICVMGAVRDATQEEEAAVIQSAKALGIKVIGANLGRVAEFTSKIIASLSAHAACRQLGPALSELLRLSGGEDGASSIVKLPPARAGGWTWDGKSNRMVQERVPVDAKVFVGSLPARIKEDQLRKLFSKYGEITRHGQDIHMMPPGQSGMLCAFVKMANTTQATAAVEAIHEKFRFSEDDEYLVTAQTRFDEKPVKGEKEEKKKELEASVESQLHLHFVSWLPFPSKKLTADMNKRDEMHVAVALVVNALWRSRLGSEAQGGEEAMSKGPVIPELTLVFSDGVFLKLTQHSLAVSMASRHQAAPSEFQVLTSLVALLQQHGNRQAKGDTAAALGRIVESASREATHGLKLLNLSHQAPKSDSSLLSISMLAYDKTVFLEPAALMDGEKHRYLCLLETPHSLEELKVVAGAADGCDIISASLAGDAMSCSPGATLALMQHWAYNRRFVPAMARLIPTTAEKTTKRKEREEDPLVEEEVVVNEEGMQGEEPAKKKMKKKKKDKKDKKLKPEGADDED